MSKIAPAITSNDVLSGKFCLKKDTIKPVRLSVKRTYGRVVGYLPSIKNGRSVGWESQLEGRACERFEFSNQIISYLEQPVRIEVPARKNFFYTPDFKLTLKSGKVVFVEIKPLRKLRDDELKRRFVAANRFFKSFDCHFIVITDAELPTDILQRNIRMLRPYNKVCIDKRELSFYLEFIRKNPNAELHHLFAIAKQPVHPYSLLAKRIVHTDLTQLINLHSDIKLTEETHHANAIIQYRSAPCFKQHKLSNFQH
jgi:hypothetical protein